MTRADTKDRKHRILEAIILSYAETESPVGSEFLLERYPLGVSSATVRNAMVELEEEELITHPHTSAGRIPTDHGYRYYVDLLMERGRLAIPEEEAIQSVAGMRGEEPAVALELQRGGKPNTIRHRNCEMRYQDTALACTPPPCRPRQTTALNTPADDRSARMLIRESSGLSVR